MTYDELKEIVRVNAEQFPTYKEGKAVFVKSGHYNKGVQKALDSFYSVLTLKNGTKIFQNKKGQIVIQKKTGQFRKQKGYERFIKQYEEMKKK